MSSTKNIKSTSCEEDLSAKHSNITSVDDVSVRSTGTSSTVLMLLEEFKDNPEAIRLIAGVMQNPDSYPQHHGLKNFLKKQPINDAILAYVDEYHDMMYELSSFSGLKSWHKFDNLNILHCEKKGPDGQTLPAIIYEDGSKSWYINGKYHRNDKDENGRALPTFIYGNGEVIYHKNGLRHREDRGDDGYLLPAYKDNISTRWYHNGELHRVELGPDGKALPAVISKGDNAWYYENRSYTQDEMTEKIKTAQLAEVFKKFDITFVNDKLTIGNITGNVFIQIDESSHVEFKNGVKSFMVSG